MSKVLWKIQKFRLIKSLNKLFDCFVYEDGEVEEYMIMNFYSCYLEKSGAVNVAADKTSEWVLTYDKEFV